MRIQKNASLKLILIILFLFYVFASSFVVYKYQHRSGDNLFNLGFDFGSLVQNIVNNNIYKDGIFTGHRMPLIPYFLSAIALAYNNLLFAYLVKNLIFFSLLSACIYAAAKNSQHLNRYILFGIAIYALSFPQLLLHGFSIEVEEGYLVAFISALFVGLLYSGKIKNKWIFLCLALLNGLMFLTKTSMPFFSAMACLLYYFVTKSRKVFLTFAVVLVISAVSWGLFNLHNSGRFNISCSLNGYTFYKSNNELTLTVYPKYSIDLLSDEIWSRRSKGDGMNEWDIDRYFVFKALEFIKGHPLDEIRLLLLRLYVVFLGISDTANIYGETHLLLKKIGMLYMLIFRVIFLGSILIAAKSIFAAKGRPLLEGDERRTVSTVYLVFISSFIVYYLFGGVCQRHIIPLVPVTLFYLVWILNENSRRALYS